MMEIELSEILRLCVQWTEPVLQFIEFTNGNRATRSFLAVTQSFVSENTHQTASASTPSKGKEGLGCIVPVGE